MRKLSLLIAGSLVLLLGAQAQVAFAADPEPSCDGLEPGLQGLHYSSTPTTGGATASAFAGVALCGTDVTGFISGTLNGGYTEAWLVTPGGPDGGVTFRCANPARPDNAHHQYCDNAGGDDLESESYYAESGTGLVTCLAGRTLCNLESLATGADVYVNWSGQALVPPNPNCNSQFVVQCLQTTDRLGLAWMDITIQPCQTVAPCASRDPWGNRYAMHLLTPQTIAGTGFTVITQIGEPDYEHPGGPEPDADDYITCEFAGAPDSGACGSDTGRWIQKNPPTGDYPCTGSPQRGLLMFPITRGSTPSPGLSCEPVNYS